MDFDAIIADAKASAEAQTETKPVDATEENTEVTEEVESSEPNEPEDAAPEKAEEPFPKKAVNALSRKDKKIGKLTAQLQAERQKNEALAKQAPKPEVKDDAPREEDFATYGEYLRAEARYAARQEIKETKAAPQKAKEETPVFSEEVVERRQELAAKAQETFSDFNKVLDKAFEGVKLKPHVIEVLDEADNGALALYALAKEDFDLDDLNDLTSAKAAMLIARYEDKAAELSAKKQVTKAPAPMTPNKGLGSGSKQVANMSTTDLLKWVTT